MITVKEAIHAVHINSSPLFKSEKKSLKLVVGHILSEDIYSPINMPPFRQSSMDGYAVCLHESLSYSLIGEVKAGDSHQPNLIKGEAVRIFTGAAVPDTANAIIMQEKVRIVGAKITIDDHLPIGHNIRPLGEQIKKGELALEKGTKLTPASIGYLTALGITGVKVFEKPSVALITTGNELIEAGQPLAYGSIYESNSGMLMSALSAIGYNHVSIHKVEDHYIKTRSKLKNVIGENDMVIISGGISVGDYDFVGKALQELQVKQLFYKVKQKPGKPIFFGKKENTMIFALPGNPAAALTCFYLYVYSSLQKIEGSKNTTLPRVMAKSTTCFEKIGDRAQFLKAIYNKGEATILEGQSSAMLQTFAIANALVFLPEDVYGIQKNDLVEVILLPF